MLFIYNKTPYSFELIYINQRETMISKRVINLNDAQKFKFKSYTGEGIFKLNWLCYKL